MNRPAKYTFQSRTEQTKQAFRSKSAQSGCRRSLLPGGHSRCCAHFPSRSAARSSALRPVPDDHNLDAATGQLYYRTVWARVVELMRKAGLQALVCARRRLHASSLLSNGVPIAVVSERLGHSDQNITLSIYSHALPADTKAAARVWNDTMADVIADARKHTGERTLCRCLRKREKVQTLKRVKEEDNEDDGGLRNPRPQTDRPAAL